MYRVVGGTRWVGGVSVVWAEKRRSPAMTTEGGVEVQLERERQGRERERRRSPAMTTKGGVEVQLERERQGREREGGVQR